MSEQTFGITVTVLLTLMVCYQIFRWWWDVEQERRRYREELGPAYTGTEETTMSEGGNR
jgi:hypothetical protein